MNEDETVKRIMAEALRVSRPPTFIRRTKPTPLRPIKWKPDAARTALQEASERRRADRKEPRT